MRGTRKARRFKKTEFLATNEGNITRIQKRRIDADGDSELLKWQKIASVSPSDIENLFECWHWRISFCALLTYKKEENVFGGRLQQRTIIWLPHID